MVLAIPFLSVSVLTQCSASSFQICPAPPYVRLKVTAYCPHVPSVDEHQVLVRAVWLEPGKSPLQPALVKLRCGSPQDNGSALASWTIVPAGGNAGKPLVRRRVSAAHQLCHAFVAIDIVLLVGLARQTPPGQEPPHIAPAQWRS